MWNILELWSTSPNNRPLFLGWINNPTWQAVKSGYGNIAWILLTKRKSSRFAIILNASFYDIFPTELAGLCPSCAFTVAYKSGNILAITWQGAKIAISGYILVRYIMGGSNGSKLTPHIYLEQSNIHCKKAWHQCRTSGT